MKRRLLAILLTVCMVFSMSTTALAAGSVFTDVKTGDWFAEYVEWAYDNKVMNGVGNNKFDPEGTVTRAMIWVTLARLVEKDDANSNPWWAAGRAWAMAEGVSDGTYPEQNVTREQLVTMIYRFTKDYLEMDVSAGENTSLSKYSDAAKINSGAGYEDFVPAMKWAIGANMISGFPNGTLQPQGNATRAQLAAMLNRYVDHVEDIMPEVTPAPEVTPTPTPEVTPTPVPHSHTYANDWTHDATNHWKAATCEHTGEKADNAAHTLVEGKCSVCGVYVVTNTAELQAAINTATHGETIRVAAGDYDAVDFRSHDTRNDNVTIIGEGDVYVAHIYISVHEMTAPVNLTIQNITFDEIGIGSNDIEVTGLTVENCKFTKGAGITLANKTITDTEVRNCTFSDKREVQGNNATPVYIHGPAVGLTVEGCTFEEVGYNAVQLANTVDGEIVINKNTINGTDDRVLRFGDVKATAKLTISNNTVTSKGDDKGQVVKATNIASGSAIVLSDNTWNGYTDAQLTYAGGIWTLPVQVADGLDLFHSTTYEVSSANGLSHVAGLMSNSDHNATKNIVVKLVDNIDMTGQAWTPVTDFYGVFDGNGKTISGLTITTTGEAGMFGANAHNGDGFPVPTIKNLTISGAKVTGDQKVGVVCGGLGVANIENVTVTGANITGTKYVGGISGYAYNSNPGITITGCTVSGSTIKSEGATDDGKVGGIIGFAALGKVTNNNVTGCTISGKECVGGVVGRGGSGETTATIYGNTVSGNTVTATGAGVTTVGDQIGDSLKVKDS